jgi:hypothetical protein
MNRSS